MANCRPNYVLSPLCYSTVGRVSIKPGDCLGLPQALLKTIFKKFLSGGRGLEAITFSEIGVTKTSLFRQSFAFTAV